MPAPDETDQPANADLRSELLAMCADDGAAVGAFLADADNHRRQFERTQTIRSGTSCVVLLRDAVADGEAHPRHLAAIADSLRLGNDEPPEFASLPDQYELDDHGRAVFRWNLGVAAIDQRRAAIGLPSLAADLARRRSGAPAYEIGPGLWEPWPPRRDAPN